MKIYCCWYCVEQFYYFICKLAFFEKQFTNVIIVEKILPFCIRVLIYTDKRFFRGFWPSALCCLARIYRYFCFPPQSMFFKYYGKYLNFYFIFRSTRKNISLFWYHSVLFLLVLQGPAYMASETRSKFLGEPTAPRKHLFMWFWFDWYVIRFTISFLLGRN